MEIIHRGPGQLLVSLLLAALLVAPAAARQRPLRPAVFPFIFDDSSLQPPQPAELARLRNIDAQMRDLLSRSGRYAPVDIAPVQARVNAQRLDGCPACAVALAGRLGAKVAVVAWVQKVSNLILNINAVILSVPSGKRIAAGSVDIRGNTDQSWARGVDSLVTSQLLDAAR